MTSVTIERRPPQTIIRFAADLDAASVPACRAAIDAGITEADSLFLIDIGRVEFIDSHGVGLFVSLLKKAHRKNGRMTFLNAQDQPLAVLKMVGFNTEIVDYKTTEEGNR